MKKIQSGQALVTLLVFVGLATAVTAGAVAIAVINVQSTSQFNQGQRAYDLAEAGAEDAIMHLERDQSFSSTGYTIQISSNNTFVVSVTPTGIATTKTIISEGTVNIFKRKVQIVGSFDGNGVFSITSWNEIDD